MAGTQDNLMRYMCDATMQADSNADTTAHTHTLQSNGIKKTTLLHCELLELREQI